MTEPAARTRFLSALDAGAELRRDDVTEGWILSIGGAEQSHVDPGDPTRVLYEYLRRIAHLADLVLPPGQPVRALHLGGGAMTLPRYLAATRPGSAQTVVELARELPGFVLEHLPWPAGAEVTLRIGDARAELAQLRAEGAGSTDALADLAVLDVFAGDDAPAHLRERSFYSELAEILSERGVLAVNVGDDPGLEFFAEQARAMLEATGPDGAPVLADVWCLTDTTMLRGDRAGNLILAGSPSPMPRPWLETLRAAGPHPCSVLDRMELEGWITRLEA